MGSASKRTGERGEVYATEWLVERGWKIIERNAWYPWGEIDIIAHDTEGVLVLVEVKTVREGRITAEDQVTGAKLTKFRRTALGYANAHPKLVGNLGWRLDVLALTEVGEGYKIGHYENVG